MGQNGSIGRETLPIPDRPHVGLVEAEEAAALTSAERDAI
jgi:hypothetical protein